MPGERLEDAMRIETVGALGSFRRQFLVAKARYRDARRYRTVLTGMKLSALSQWGSQTSLRSGPLRKIR